MDRRERGGAGGRLGGPFPPREQVARAGRAAWRHSAATVATGEDDASVLPAQHDR